jgi:copper chaperone CopZ
VRGALEPLAGVKQVQIKVGVKDFSVVYDAAKVQPAAIAKAVEDAGEGVDVQP